MELQLIVQLIARYDRELLEQLGRFAFYTQVNEDDETALELLAGFVQDEFSKLEIEN